MPRDIPTADARSVASACLGAISGPDGATDEQLALLRAIAAHLWQLPDVDLSPEAALTAEESADRITDGSLRRRTRELMVMLELCRHPLEDTHAERVEEYCHALGGDGHGIAIVREYVSAGAGAAFEDWMRRFTPEAAETMEPVMVEISQVDDEEAAARIAQIEAELRAAAPGTLGAEFVSFCDRNDFEIGAKSLILFGHDMTHVISGYEATSIGEICNSVMKLMITDSDAHWLEMLASMMIHETGILFPGYEPHVSPLADPANIELVAVAMERGRATTSDYSLGDHMSMIHWPYDDVLAHYGVPPL